MAQRNARNTKRTIDNENRSHDNGGTSDEESSTRLHQEGRRDKGEPGKKEESKTKGEAAQRGIRDDGATTPGTPEASATGTGGANSRNAKRRHGAREQSHERERAQHEAGRRLARLQRGNVRGTTGFNRGRVARVVTVAGAHRDR